MSDLEEEQPTQERGRRDWSSKGKPKTQAPLTGPGAMDGDAPLVPSPDTVAEAHEGKLDGNPGGTLMREGDLDPDESQSS